MWVNFVVPRTITTTYSQGYDEKRGYIASQAPMTINFGDFWKMIWEQNVKSVVMLSKLVEDGQVLW